MFTVGTDTEFFLQREGHLVSAIPLIHAEKRCPQILSSGGNITHDNVAMEFATPVANSEESFIAAIKATLLESLMLLPKDIILDKIASVDFPETELDNEKAKQFGCSPDFDAWSVCMNQVPEGATERPFRCVGGHLHLGYVKNSGNDFLLEPFGKIDVVKALDLLVGIPFTILDHSEAAINRRKLYGRAGCHRPTDYGVEYRALSNFWTFSPELVSLVYSLAGEALSVVRNKVLYTLVDKITPEEIQRIINDGDYEKASLVWQDTIAPTLPRNIVQKFERAREKSSYDIYKEWELNDY